MKERRREAFLVNLVQPRFSIFAFSRPVLAGCIPTGDFSRGALAQSIVARFPIKYQAPCRTGADRSLEFTIFNHRRASHLSRESIN